MEQAEVVVIGAGPTGLAAARVLSDRGHRALVLEAGSELPSRNAAEGLGGAGLYSDGKFSFAPAGTGTWKLVPWSRLDEAYGWVRYQLGKITHEPIPPLQFVGDSPHISEIKSYPSIRVDLAAREKLIAELCHGLEVRLDTSVTNIRLHKDYFELTTRAKDGVSSIKSTNIILATGRLWHSRINHSFPTVFRRYEVGVRVEQPAEQFFLKNVPGLDPKWIVRLEAPEREYRTFCTCRNGHVLPVLTADGIFVSGHTDPPKTTKSNVALTVRYLAETGWRIPPSDRAFQLRYADALRAPALLRSLLGEAADHVLEALDMVGSKFGGSLDGAVLHGPSLEGVATYPDVSPTTLQFSDGSRGWVGGDATGLFRGLVPALTSGAYIGLSVHEASRKE